MAQDLKNQWDEQSMGCMPHGTKEMGDQKFLGCTIRVEPTRDVSSGDETSLHLLTAITIRSENVPKRLNGKISAAINSFDCPTTMSYISDHFLRCEEAFCDTMKTLTQRTAITLKR
jgi:hypothetical protein